MQAQPKAPSKQHLCWDKGRLSTCSSLRVKYVLLVNVVKPVSSAMQRQVIRSSCETLNGREVCEDMDKRSRMYRGGRSLLLCLMNRCHF